jgi:hypothetical protein
MQAARSIGRGGLKRGDKWWRGMMAFPLLGWRWLSAIIMGARIGANCGRRRGNAARESCAIHSLRQKTQSQAEYRWIKTTITGKSM